jgi:hypothetical protein
MAAARPLVQIQQIGDVKEEKGGMLIAAQMACG